MNKTLINNELLRKSTTNQDIVFKTPTTTAIHRRKKKQEILDEDTYVEQIGKIIERDYFPDLSKLKAQNDYLDAVARNDLVKMRELYLKYNGGSESNQTTFDRMSSPATFETPANIHNSQHTIPSTPKQSEIGNNNKSEKKLDLNLDQFLNVHTSQDNESFNEILIENDRKLREKYSYLYNEESKSEEEKLKELELPTIQEQCDLPKNDSNSNIINRWNYKNKNYIMYVPDGVDLNEEELIEFNKNRKEINTKNTRLELNPFNENQSKEIINELAKNQSKILDGKIGVDGKELLIKSTNNFNYVQTPSPSPNYLNTPLMTWGEIDGTPFHLDNKNSNNTPKLYCQSFKITNLSKRERLALELAEKVGEKNRNHKQNAINVARRQFSTPSPRPNSNSDRLLTMSPAARKLAQTKLGLNTDVILSPFSRTKTPQTPRILSNKQRSSVQTPKLNLGIKRTTINDNNLTDDLLDLPKRQKAADFF